MQLRKHSFYRICFFIVLIVLVMTASEMNHPSLAQEKTPTGTVSQSRFKIIFTAQDSEQLPNEAKAAITLALDHWQGPTPVANTFSVIGIRWEQTWALLTIAPYPINHPSGQEHAAPDTSAWSSVLVTHSNQQWQAALEGDPAIPGLLKTLPLSELGSEARTALFPTQSWQERRAVAPAQAYNGYKFFFPGGGPSWQVSQGWHDSGYPQYFSGNHSIDFRPNGSGDVSIISMATGTVLYQCITSGLDIQTLTVIQTLGTNEKIGYLHLQKDSLAIQQGDLVVQGQKLGDMVQGNNSGDCGTSNGTHVHLYFPSKPFTIETATFSDPTVPIGGSYVSSNQYPLIPARRNIIGNGDFSNGFNKWTYWGDIGYSVTDKLTFYRQNPSPNGGGAVYTGAAWRVPANAPLETLFMLGNSSNVSKSLRVVVSNQSDEISCTINIPANQPLTPFRMRGKTHQAWSGIRLDLTPNPADGVAGIVIDDIAVRYQPELSVTATECASFTIPPNTNLLWNGEFDTFDYWNVWGEVDYRTDGRLNFKRRNPSPNGGSIYTGAVYANNIPVNSPFAFNLQIGNSSNVNKSLRLSLNNGTNAIECILSIAPAQTLRPYRMVGRTSGGIWSGMRIDLFPNPADGIPDMIVDQLVLQYRPDLNPSGAECGWDEATPTPTFTPTATPTLTSVPARPDTIGVYKDGTFYLRHSNAAGAADVTTVFGGDLADLPVVGDWNGDGVDTIGVYRTSTGFFFLSNSNAVPSVAYQVLLGNPNDTPFAGKWRADMGGDGIGVFRPSNGILYQKRELTSGFSDYFAVFGNPGDVGIAGDWDGNGSDSIGVYRSSNTTWYMTYNSEPGGITYGDIGFVWDIGSGTPVVGDWDGDGATTVGYRVGTTFVLHSTNAVVGTDTPIVFGVTGGVPIAGKWTLGSQPNPALLIPVIPAASGHGNNLEGVAD